MAQRPAPHDTLAPLLGQRMNAGAWAGWEMRCPSPRSVPISERQSVGDPSRSTSPNWPTCCFAPKTGLGSARTPTTWPARRRRRAPARGRARPRQQSSLRYTRLGQVGGGGGLVVSHEAMYSPHVQEAEMVRRFSVAEARAQLPHLLHAVEHGEQVEITRRGEPVAVVLSLSEFRRIAGPHGGFNEDFARWHQSAGTEDRDLPVDYFRNLRDRGPGRRVRV